MLKKRCKTLEKLSLCVIRQNKSLPNLAIFSICQIKSLPNIPFWPFAKFNPRQNHSTFVIQFSWFFSQIHLKLIPLELRIERNLYT